MMDVSKDVGGEIAFAIFVAEKKVDTARIDAARAEIGIVYIGLDWCEDSGSAFNNVSNEEEVYLPKAKDPCCLWWYRQQLVVTTLAGANADDERML